MFIGLIVGLVIRVLIGIIVAGSICATIREITRPNWTRNMWVRMLILLAEGMCAPAKRLMIGIGIPTRPLDFSPLVTIVALEIVGRLLGLVF